MAPFEEMQQQNREAAHEFALLGFAHALDFLGDRLKVGFAGPASAQERRLFEGPGVEIAVVQGASRRHSTKATPALQACRSFVSRMLMTARKLIAPATAM